VINNTILIWKLLFAVSRVSSVKLSWRKKFLLCMVCLLCIETCWLIMFDSAHCTPSNNVAQYRVGYHWKLQTPPLWKNVFSSNRGRGKHFDHRQPTATNMFTWLNSRAKFCCKMWGDSLVWNQYSHRVDAKVTFYVYRFPILFVEVFWEQQ